MVVKLMTNPPLPTYSFSDKHVVRFTVILLNAIGVVHGGRDTSLAAEAVFQQLPLLPQAMVHASTLSAPPASYLPPSPYPPASARPFHLDDRNTHERHREQFGDADQRGQRSRSHRDRSPARQRRHHTEQSPPDRRSRSRSRGRHHPDRRHRSYSASPSSPRRRRSRSRSARSRSPRPTRTIRQPPNPILGPPSKFATDCLAGVGTPFSVSSVLPKKTRETVAAGHNVDLFETYKLIAATAARAQVFSGGQTRPSPWPPSRTCPPRLSCGSTSSNSTRRVTRLRARAQCLRTAYGPHRRVGVQQRAVDPGPRLTLPRVRNQQLFPTRRRNPGGHRGGAPLCLHAPPAPGP